MTEQEMLMWGAWVIGAVFSYCALCADIDRTGQAHLEPGKMDWGWMAIGMTLAVAAASNPVGWLLTVYVTDFAKSGLRLYVRPYRA